MTKDSVLAVLRGLSVDELASILPESSQSSRVLAPSQKERRSQEIWNTLQVSLLELLDDDTHTRLLELDDANEIGTITPEFWSSVFSSVLPGAKYKPDLRAFPWDPMVDFRPQPVPPDVQRQFKFKPALATKEDVYKSVLDKHFRPLARFMWHATELVACQIPSRPEQVKANLEEWTSLMQLATERFWISFSELNQQRRAISLQALGMTEEETQPARSLLSESDLARCKEVVEHRARMKELSGGLQLKKPAFKKKKFKKNRDRSAASGSDSAAASTTASGADVPRADDSSLSADRSSRGEDKGSTPTRKSKGGGRGRGNGK